MSARFAHRVGVMAGAGSGGRATAIRPARERASVATDEGNRAGVGQTAATVRGAEGISRACGCDVARMNGLYVA